MVDAEEFERWREEASRALAGAEAQAGLKLYNWGCFSCEQAAQLAVKALLHGLAKGPWGHDLDGLVNEVGLAGFELTEEVRAAASRLGRHYIPSRYPDAHATGSPGQHYRESDWVQAQADTQTILNFIDTVWDRR